MLVDLLDYLRKAIIFAFVNSARSFHDDILSCEDVESLANFCSGYRKIGQLCFVVDQLNALDPEPMGQDEVSDEKKALLRSLVQRMSAQHIQITSASANQKTFQHMATRDTGERRVPLLGGMTPVRVSFYSMMMILMPSFPLARNGLLVEISRVQGFQ